MREEEWHAAKGPRPGLEPGSGAARTKPLYMGPALPSGLNSATKEISLLDQIKY